MHDYIPERDDYLNWKDDWNKIPQWLDGTHTLFDTKYGEYQWNKDGFTHRIGNDKPALIFDDRIVWKQNGKHYRENDKPTVIYDDGKRGWFKERDILHRDYDRPAIITYEGYKEWWKNNKQYYPIQSIQKSILFNPKKELVELYIHQLDDEDSLADLYNLDNKSTTSKLFTPDFQKQLLDKNPSFASLIPRDILIPEYEGLGILGDLGL